jgi:hypothetical protein
MNLVSVVLQYTKKQNHTYTHSKQYTTHKITNTMFQRNKEPKLELQHNNTDNTKYTKKINK